MGPYRPVDTSAPINPHLAAMVSQGNIRVYLTQHGYDLESRVTGYQYAVVQRSPTGAVQNWSRDYPEDGATDVGPVCTPAPPKIGRASCRESEKHYVRAR